MLKRFCLCGAFVFVVTSLSFAAPVIKDGRDGRAYKTISSGNLNWFSINASFEKNSFKGKSNAFYYQKENWKNVCPEGTHIPDIKEWDYIIDDKFTGPRKKQNAKSFAGKTRGYYDLSKSKSKVLGKDFAYFAIGNTDGTKAMMLDLKRGAAKSVTLPASAAVTIRCVSERDIFAEKNISKSEMLFTDERDEKQYKVEVRGDVIWFAENLRYGITNAEQCLLEDIELCRKYGRFYTHKEAKKACPKGWHLPDDGEWRDFQKDRSRLDWNAMGKGGCKDWDQYCDASSTGHYWSATSIKKNTGRSWEFRREGRNINRTDESDMKGLYVRCVTEMK